VVEPPLLTASVRCYLSLMLEEASVVE